MKFSYFMPNMLEGRFTPIGSVTPESMLERARAAEDLGYDGIWVGEFIETQRDVATGFPGEPPNNYAPIVTMTAVAMATKRPRITSGVIVLPYHDPLVLGREMATLDQLSGGRVTLGVGLGGPVDAYLRTRRQYEKVNRSKMIDECILAMRALWTQPRASFEGEYFGFSDVETYPKPVQDPFPVAIATRTESGLQRLAQLAQSWIEVTMDADAMKAGIERLRQYRADLGRAGEPLEVSRQFFMSIGETDDEAQAIRAAAVPYKSAPVARKGMTLSDEQPGFERYFVGSVDYIRRRFEAYARAGVTEMCVNFFEPDTTGALRQLELFARKVMPDLK